ncbi:MAG: type II toxin-antitoxin system RelE/ParE family toxin [Pseudomonadota bacterium]
MLEHPTFAAEREGLSDAVADKLDAMILLLEEFGPDLGRPYADRLNGSGYSNMKELRFTLSGVWRFAFAFDPKRNAVVLVGGNKEGKNQKRFYKQLIATADARFADWLTADE